MGVFVLGMHRSGTSAVTRVVDLLGVPVGEPRMDAGPDNPTGYWEVPALADLNDELLARFGGSWDAPPAFPDGWASAGDLADLRDRAARAFAAAHPGPQWVWKDPRACLLLPFWREVVPGDHAAIVVVRNPLAIAASLARRNRLAVVVSLALWERSMRAVLAGVGGWPVLVVRYEALVASPVAGAEQIAAFLVSAGAHDDPVPASGVAASFLRADLRHDRTVAADVRADPRGDDAQRALFEQVEALVGEHPAFEPPELGPASAAGTAILAARRAGNAARGVIAGDAASAGGAWGVSAEQDELLTLDQQCGWIGHLEHVLAAREAELARVREPVAAVEASLGSLRVGRVERAALRLARLARLGRRSG